MKETVQQLSQKDNFVAAFMNCHRHGERKRSVVNALGIDGNIFKVVFEADLDPCNIKLEVI